MGGARCRYNLTRWGDSLRIGRSKHMAFEDLFIYALGSKGFRLNGTEDITIDGNTIDVGSTTSSLCNGIVASSSSTSVFATTSGEMDLTISDNEIKGITTDRLKCSVCI